MKYLVTGGAGFIGSHICEELISKGNRVICIDSLVGSNIDNIKHLIDHENFTFVYENITSLNKMKHYCQDIDIVLHQAASKCTVCQKDPEIDLLTNARGSWCIFEASRLANVKKVIHASTGSIATIKSFYGVSKQAGESYLKAFHSYYNLRYTALRYHHIYGSQQNAKEGGGVVAIFIRQVLNNEPCTIFGDGLQVRHFTHVKDAVAANLFAATDSRTDMRILNVISRTTMSILDLANTIHHILGKTPRVIHLPPKPGEIRTFSAKGTELEIMGFKFNNDFISGLTKTIEWYKNVL